MSTPQEKIKEEIIELLKEGEKLLSRPLVKEKTKQSNVQKSLPKLGDPEKDDSHLGDIRNLSAHSKNREPTKIEIADILQGVQKIIKTVF